MYKMATGYFLSVLLSGDLWPCVGPTTAAKLNASSSLVDEVLLSTNQLASRMNVVNASINDIGDNVTDLLAANDSNSQRISQLNDRCK